MTEVKRWEPRNTAVGYDMQPLPDGSFVLFQDLEAEYALRLEADRHRDLLMQAVADAAHKAGIIRDGALCDGPTLLMLIDDLAEDNRRQIERADEAERQVGELRDQLDEALGWVKWAEQYVEAYVSKSFFGKNSRKDLNRMKTFLGSAFPNTTSTEGKDHE